MLYHFLKLPHEPLHPPDDVYGCHVSSLWTSPIPSILFQLRRNNRDGGVRGSDGEGGDAGDGARRTSRKRPLHLRPQEEGDTGTLVQGVL